MIKRVTFVGSTWLGVKSDEADCGGFVVGESSGKLLGVEGIQIEDGCVWGVRGQRRLGVPLHVVKSIEGEEERGVGHATPERVARMQPKLTVRAPGGG